MSLQITNKTTDYTSYNDQVYVDGRYLKREQVWYKQFTSEAQAERVVQQLIIESNFYPEFKKDMVVFSNPLDTQTKYFYYPYTFEMEKVKIYNVDYL